MSCAIDGCSRQSRTRGWCATHYRRWLRHGDPNHVVHEYGTPEADEKRFWGKVIVGHPLGCWQWVGGLTGDGYGTLSIGGLTRLAHRVAYQLLIGDVPEGLQLDHLCRNRACVNPDHLEPVTRQENILRSESPSARSARVTQCPRGHVYTSSNTYVDPGRGGRHCRSCQRDRQSKRDRASREVTA